MLRRVPMVKAIIVYESKYGNTRLVGETIAEGMKVPEMDITPKEVREVKPEEAVGYDVIIIGSPNHMGQQVGSIKKFIDRLGKLNLSEKYAAVFDTYMMKDYEKAVKKMEKQISEKIPDLKLALPGVSIKVLNMKGPVAEGELSKAKEFGAKIVQSIPRTTE